MIAQEAYFLLEQGSIRDHQLQEVTVLNADADWLLIRMKSERLAEAICLFDHHLEVFGRRRDMDVAQLYRDAKLPYDSLRSPSRILELIIHGYQKLGLSTDSIVHRLQAKQQLSCTYQHARDKWLTLLAKNTT